MKITVTRLTDWKLVADEARRTAWKPPIDHEPSSAWKRKILVSEHSPIESLIFRIQMEGIKYFSSVHLTRHHVGMTHWVSSQRPDRSPTGTDRHSLPQDAPVSHDMVLNAHAIINISRRRLCAQASPETRAVWQAVVEEIRNIGEVELADACVPECVHRGFCPEFKSCGLAYSSRFQSLIDHYRKPAAANFSAAPQNPGSVRGDSLPRQPTHEKLIDPSAIP